MRWAGWIVIGLAAAGLLGGAACATHHNRQGSADQWDARGKLFLEKGDGASAYLAFVQALDFRPGDLDANYGIVLADVQQFAATMQLLFSSLGGSAATTVTPEEASAICQKLDSCGVLTRDGSTYAACLTAGGCTYGAATCQCIAASPDCPTLFNLCLGQNLPPDQPTCDSACVRFGACGFLAGTPWTPTDCAANCATLFTESELTCFNGQTDCNAGVANCFTYYGATIDEIIQQFWSPISQEMQQSVANVQGNNALLFDLDYYTVALIPALFQPVFSGVHDQVTLQFFAGIVSGIDALFQLAQGLDLDLNPQTFAKLGMTQIGGNSIFPTSLNNWETLLQTLEQIDDIIVLILYDPVYRNGLKLAANGSPFLNQAGIDIGGLFGAWATTIQKVRDDNENEPDRVIRYVDLNGDGQWDGDEPLLVPGIVELDFNLAWIVHDLLVALEVSIADDYPFHFRDLAPLFEYMNLPLWSAFVKLLDLTDQGTIDLGAPFREPSPDGLRPMLADVHEFIQSLERVANQPTQ
jgi:hypothetical protein